jgi:hypothetical protein
LSQADALLLALAKTWAARWTHWPSCSVRGVCGRLMLMVDEKESVRFRCAAQSAIGTGSADSQERAADPDYMRVVECGVIALDVVKGCGYGYGCGFRYDRCGFRCDC